MEAVGKALGNIERAPSTIAIITRLAAQERRIEENDIEALAGDRLKEIPMACFDLALQSIYQRIDARTAYRRGVDVDRNDATRVPCREQRANARACAHIEHLGVRSNHGAVEHRGEELSRSQPLRVKDARRHDKGDAADPLDDEIIVPVQPSQATTEVEEPDESAGTWGKADGWRFRGQAVQRRIGMA